MYEDAIRYDEKVEPGIYTNAVLLDVESLHPYPHSIKEPNLFEGYTRRFVDILRDMKGEE